MEGIDGFRHFQIFAFGIGDRAEKSGRNYFFRGYAFRETFHFLKVLVEKYEGWFCLRDGPFELKCLTDIFLMHFNEWREDGH